MKPMLKYSGGKSKEILFFQKYIPEQFDTYYEPFLGGGALYFHLEPQKAVINDINSRLMGFYNDVRDKYDLVRSQLDHLQSRYERNQNDFMSKRLFNPNEKVENRNEAMYYELRDCFNHIYHVNLLDSVIYFFINKTAYSGIIRYNAKGEYNVPFGRYKNFNTQLVTKEHSELLRRSSLFTGDYLQVFEMTTKDDFMFLDPPYDCVFNHYGNIEYSNGFDEKEQERLADNFKNLKCKAMMIIGKTPLTAKLYKDYIRDEYFKSYAFNIRNRVKAEAKHIIVLNF